jgi:hypothetical protein
MKGIRYIVLLSAATMLIVPRAIGQPRITSKVNISPEAKLTDQEKESISLSAGQILIHVNKAREALKVKDISRAKEQVEKGLALANIIKTALPTFDVETQVTAGKLHYEDKDKVQPSLVTLHEELNAVALLEPVRTSKKEADQTEAAIQHRPVAANVEMRESRAQLDINLALAGLEKAKQALAENKIDEADHALAVIQTGVVFEYIVADLPLERASTNLLIAREAIKEHKQEEAKAALQVAFDSLSEYAASSDAPHAKEVSDLKNEVQNLASGDLDNTSAQEAVTKCWQKIATWSE